MKFLESKFKFLNKLIDEPKEYLLNSELWKYHILSSIKSLQGLKFSDSFRWEIYTHHYIGELQLMSRRYSVALKRGDYTFKGGKLKKCIDSMLPLYSNWHLIYETILKINPKSVLEIGCGGGMHLANLLILNPKLIVKGVDRSGEQLNLLEKTYSNLKEYCTIFDITSDRKVPIEMKSDLVFSHAVLMHIFSSREAYLKALENMFNFSRKYVLILEKWGKHKILNDIKVLHKNKRIGWKNIYYYYEEYPKENYPKILICSKVKLKFNKLSKYSQLQLKTQ